MDMTQLERFKVVAECENISKAAETLFISQSALSRTMQQIEKELGVKLFRRNKNKISLNDNGKIFLKHINKILADFDKMLSSLKCTQEINKLHIGSSLPGFLRFIIPYFQSRYNNIHLEVAMMEQSLMIESLLDGSLDIIVFAEPIVHEDISTYSFSKDCLLLSVPVIHPFSERGSIHFSELRNQKITMIYDTNSYWNKKIKLLIKKTDINLEILYQTDSMVFHELLKKTNFLAFTTTMTLNYYNDIPNRSYIPIADKDAKITTYIGYLKEHKNSAVDTFLNWLKINFRFYCFC